MDTEFPDRRGFHRIKIRDNALTFGIYEHRRSSKDHHPSDKCVFFKIYKCMTEDEEIRIVFAFQ
ncbi:hypothetical protein DPMN_137588 [Dreissena polymorpha]|uniref:Uncharacterized protein n=1 Tax=Dreissena polymorpha TaxID=45954 RepID=A0A9D4JIZ1_DREPO|nr:hypothetical protein DPMN_137588 [Dreissena polymorpha]